MGSFTFLTNNQMRDKITAPLETMESEDTRGNESTRNQLISALTPSKLKETFERYKDRIWVIPATFALATAVWASGMAKAEETHQHPLVQEAIEVGVQEMADQWRYEDLQELARIFDMWDDYVERLVPCDDWDRICEIWKANSLDSVETRVEIAASERREQQLAEEEQQLAEYWNKTEIITWFVEWEHENVEEVREAINYIRENEVQIRNVLWEEWKEWFEQLLENLDFIEDKIN